MKGEPPKNNESMQISDGPILTSDIPKHWKSLRIGGLFTERREKVSDKDFQPLSVTKNGIVPQLDTAAKTDDGDNRKKVNSGDFVINSRSDRKGSSGLSTFDGSVSLINTVMTPKGIDGSYVHHLFRSVPFQEEYYRFGRGIVADLWSTNYSEMKNISIPVPPLPEQQAIADFLDRETAKIDTLIQKQEHLIELLTEKRQAILDHFVTRGFSTCNLQPSNIDYPTDIPINWQVKKLKRIITRVEQGSSPECENYAADQESWGVLKVGCCNGHHFDPNEQKALPVGVKPNPNYEVRNDDIIMSRGNTRELVGMASIVTNVRPKLLVSDLLFRFRSLGKHISPQFLVYALRSPYCRKQIEQSTNGTSASMQKVNQETIRSICICIPPELEQNELLQAIESQNAKIDALIAKAKLSIDLMKERRSALISAVVTGKIDVRGFSQCSMSRGTKNGLG